MVRASAYNEGDLSSIPGLGRSPGEGNGNPLQYSALKIPCTEEPWMETTVHGGRKELDMTEPLHFHFHEALYSC